MRQFNVKHAASALAQKLSFRISIRVLAIALIFGSASIALAGSSPSVNQSAAPDFNLPARAGGTMSLSQLKGQVVMINFWASYCGPCREEMPLLEQMAKKYKPLGFTLLGVNVD